MKSLLKKTRTLTFTELLALNGGYSGSSGGSGGSSSTSSSSSHTYSSNGYGSSSGSNSYSKYTSHTSHSNDYSKYSDYGSSSSGKHNYNQERITILSNGGYYSSTTGYHDVSQGTPSTIQSHAGDPSKGDYELTQSKPSMPGTIDNPIHDYLIEDKIIATAQIDTKDTNIVYGDYDFRCDNYVQDVLTRCGVDWSDYFAGDANSKTCKDHIDNLDSSKLTKGSDIKSNERAVYVCFMGDYKDGTGHEHCALMIVDGNGSFSFYDNSSGNNITNHNGSVLPTTGKTLSEIEASYKYNSFYYQRVK